jgi:hypothetical protein
LAVAFDTSTESHTGTTGAASVASFTWNHTGGGSARAALVFAFTQPLGTDITTSVTYGGTNMVAVTGGFATDTVTEPGSCKAYFLDNCGTGTKAVVVNRTNNTTIMYAVAATVTAAGACTVAGVTVQQGDQAPAQANITDGGGPTNSVRFAGAYYGGSAPPVAGANSTAMQSIDFGLLGCGTVRETTAGTGSRPVGFADASDDWACVLLAIREIQTYTDTGFGKENG